MNNTPPPRHLLRLLGWVVVIGGSLLATAAALLGLLATRSKLLMGVLGFDGFIGLQLRRGVTPIERYGGLPHRLVVYALLAVLAGLSAALIATTWRAARHRPLTPALRLGADVCHGCMWAVLTTALLAAFMHVGGVWEAAIYGGNDEVISHHMMQVRPPRYERIALLLAMALMIAGLFTWALRHAAPSPRTVADLTRRTLVVLAVGVGMHLMSLLWPIDRTTGMFTAAALSTLAVFWSLGTFGLQAAAIPITRRRHPEGHCQTCGYNLHGTTSEACPECGTTIDPPTPTT